MNSELCRAVQLRELEILKAIMEICDRHGLRWFAIAGTCLGAVRHGGFIPWDDDLDIGMPRRDYEKFRAIAKQELPPYLELLDYDAAKRTTRMFLKVHDIRTSCIENSLLEFPELHTGVWVDVFPIDGYPAPGLKRLVLAVRLTVLEGINMTLRMPDSAAGNRKERRQMRLYKLLRGRVPFNWASRRIDGLIKKYVVEKCACAVNALTWFFPSYCVAELAKRPFEGIEIFCPKDYNAYLTAAYGDYMQLPPEEARNSGHTVAYLSLERPYKEWDGSVNRETDAPPLPLEARMALFHSKLVRYDYLREKGWKDLARDSLRGLYTGLWQLISQADAAQHEALRHYAEKVTGELMKGLRLMQAARLWLLYRRTGG